MLGVCFWKNYFVKISTIAQWTVIGASFSFYLCSGWFSLFLHGISSRSCAGFPIVPARDVSQSTKNMAAGRTQKNIDHPGVVDRVEGRSVFVRIESRSACSSCATRSYCSMTDLEDKVVEVHADSKGLYTPGQSVTVSLEESLGYKALMFGYLIPFLILVLSIFGMMWISGSEPLSALTGLGLMVPYFMWLYHSRGKLRKTFRFRIKPLQPPGI
jgi:sigma-E factor negative regulatory protein RseC